MESEEPLWLLMGSDNSQQDFPRMAYTNAWPTELFGENPSNKDDLHVLEVRTRFRTNDYARNFIELYPAVSDGAVFSPHLLEMSNIFGFLNHVELWIRSTANNYSVYMTLYSPIIKADRAVKLVPELPNIKRENGYSSEWIKWTYDFKESEDWVLQEGPELRKIRIFLEDSGDSDQYFYLDQLSSVIEYEDPWGTWEED